MTGTRPVLRWMSLAPRSTARRRSTTRSIAPKDRRRQAISLGGEPGDGVDRADRGPLDAARRVRVGQLAAQELLERAERDRKPGEPVRRAREALEGPLRAPAGARERRDPA